MRRKTISILLPMLFLLPVIAGAVSEKDFEVQTTENLINLCTAASEDPLYHQAINFCHGFLVGAYGAVAGNTGLGMAAGAVAGTAGGYLYDRHKKSQQNAKDEAYRQGFEAGKKSQ